MAVRPVQCSVCFIIADMRGMHQCPGCARVVCKACAVEPPFPKHSCIKRREVCPGFSRTGEEPEGAPRDDAGTSSRVVEGLVPMVLRRLGIRRRR